MCRYGKDRGVRGVLRRPGREINGVLRLTVKLESDCAVLKEGPASAPPYQLGAKPRSANVCPRCSWLMLSKKPWMSKRRIPVLSPA